MSSASFFLHVELICPNLEAANANLLGLDSCASATQTATPGVTTYVFYRSAPVTRRLADTANGEVGIEYLEVYLDEESFWGHVQSAEWMSGYEALRRESNRRSRTVYWAGNPPPGIVATPSWTELDATRLATYAETIYQPQVSEASEFVSLYLDADSPLDAVLQRIGRHPGWATFAAFPHPSIEGVERMIGVRNGEPLTIEEIDDWQELLAATKDGDGTIIATEPAHVAALLETSPLRTTFHLKQYAGYTLHPLRRR